MKKFVTITGSNGSLASELIKIFLKENYGLILHLRKPNNNLKKILKKYNKKLDYNLIYGDIRKKSTLEKISRFIKLKKSNILINNCGVYLSKPFSKTTQKEINDIFNINFFSNIYLLKKIYNYKFKEFLVVNINSIAGINGSKNESIYSSSKHALKGFYESLEYEKNTNFRYLNIFSGAFKSKITKNRDTYEKLIEPSELAQIIKNNIINYKNSSINNLFVKRRK